MVKLVPTNFKVAVPGKQISPVQFARDLGVSMDSTFNFDEDVTGGWGGGGREEVFLGGNVPLDPRTLSLYQG